MHENVTTPGLVSIIIPSRNEIFLIKTIQDILAKARGDIEVIVVLDGYWPNPQKREHWSTPGIVEDKRVHYLHRGQARGMRDGINSAVAVSKGEYILKCDAHVMFDEGFDIKLKADMQDNWVVVPRRKRLDAELWAIQDVGKPDVDYEFLSSPADKGAKGMIWTQRIIERLDDPKYLIDENLSFQGSCYFMKKNWYTDFLGGLDATGYGQFVRESQEIGLKTWLGGGQLMTNKKTWYAHLHKGRTYGRMYFLNKYDMDAGNAFCDDYWFNNRWEQAQHDLAWLIERFMPVPGWTPELIEQVRKK